MQAMDEEMGRDDEDGAKTSLTKSGEGQGTEGRELRSCKTRIRTKVE